MFGECYAKVNFRHTPLGIYDFFNGSNLDKLQKIFFLTFEQ